MAVSLTAKAQRRAAEVYAPAILAALADGNGHLALTLALRELQAEAAKVRKRRPAAGALADADLAGSIAAIASQLHSHKPRRPPGCPRVPGPDHLLAMFRASYAQASEEEDSDGQR
jgi:hypothetical protein